MSGDTLLNLSSKPSTRWMVSMLGLPTPMPLDRADGPWEHAPLSEESVCLGAAGGATHAALVAAIAETGAEAVDLGDDPTANPKVHALVFDATGITEVAGLRALYDFFHPRIKSIGSCGRLIVVGRPADGSAAPQQAAVTHALVGFVKSAAKELGRKGSTANLLTLDAVAEGQLEAPLRFLLTRRSAYISGQSLHVSASDGAPVWTQPLAGKTALVTGAARGIGKATAKRLAAEGARVMILDIPPDAEAIESLAAELGGIAVPLDITSEDAAAKLIEAAGGTIDIVVHNAGITRDKTLGRMSEDKWDLTLAVNLEAVLRVTEQLVEGGAVPRGGRIVLVSSIAGIAGNTGQTNYAASKAGIIGLTRSFGVAYADRGICVNAVAPGFIETRLTKAIPFGIREVGRRFCNLNQGGIPLDIAEAITFLASPGAAGLQGNVLRVCGGNLLGA
jgi:3-oxoacyl-[acyl-carrier protein] reductase